MFYDIYKELCAKNDLTPSGAAAKIGFNRASVTVWKNTGKAPKQDLLLKIADYFGVTTDYLLTGAEKEKAADPKAGGDDESLEDIIPGYDSLTEENKDRVQDYVAVLLAAQQKQ